jgi:hypothetical protein
MRKEDMLDLREGMPVIVAPAAGLAKHPIFARVRGIATTPVAVIGRTVIVEPEFVVGDFTCHPAFEIHLTPVND